MRLDQRASETFWDCGKPISVSHGLRLGDSLAGVGGMSAFPGVNILTFEAEESLSFYGFPFELLRWALRLSKH